MEIEKALLGLGFYVMSKFYKISIGAAQFGMTYSLGASKKITESEVKNILSYAEEMGISSIDTASSYGSSEKVLGKIGIKNWNVTSKLSSVPFDCKNIKSWINNETKKTLENLNIERIDSLLLHRPNQLFSDTGDEIYSALEELKKEGFIKKHGISLYSNEEIDKYLELYDFDILQTPCNILDRNIIDSGAAENYKKQGKIIQARSVFLQGLLLSHKHQNSKKFIRWKPLWDQFNAWIGDKEISPLKACINYVYSQNDIDKLIIGIMSQSQLKEILNSIDAINLEIPKFIFEDKEILTNPSNWNSL